MSGIGYDILHEHPNCDGAALGWASYRDFLIFARTVERLESGVVLSFGSAIMAPEIFLKALAMARNVAINRDGRSGVSRLRYSTWCRSRATIGASCRRPIRAITSVRIRRCWSARWRKEARASIFADASRHLPCASAGHPGGDERMNAERILRDIQKLEVLVMGDMCLDRWCYYDPELIEPSRETGIPRIPVVRAELTPGAAGTIANNLVSLGVRKVSMLGAVGDDGFGWELLARSDFAPDCARSACSIFGNLDIHLHEADQPANRRRRPAARRLHYIHIQSRKRSNRKLPRGFVIGLTDST